MSGLAARIKILSYNHPVIKWYTKPLKTQAITMEWLCMHSMPIYVWVIKL